MKLRSAVGADALRSLRSRRPRATIHSSVRSARAREPDRKSTPTLFRSGWLTTDEDEIAIRRWRGRTEILEIEATESDHPFFGTFRTRSGTRSEEHTDALPIWMADDGRG